MTADERLTAVEKELAQMRDMQGLREANAALTGLRVDRHADQLSEVTKTILPDLQAAMNEVKDASIVTAHLVAQQSKLIKGPSEWLQQHDAEVAESRQRGKDLDERISKLVSAIGEPIKKNGKAEVSAAPLSE